MKERFDHVLGHGLEREMRVIRGGDAEDHDNDAARPEGEEEEE